MVEKQKCRRTENLMEPKAGAQGDHLNVHSPKIGSWSFLRLITEFADCTPFIEIYNSPSPRPQQPQGNPRILGHFPEAFVSAFPTLPPHPPWGLRAALLCGGGRVPLGQSPPGSFLRALHVCIAATPSGPCGLYPGTFCYPPTAPSSLQGCDGHTAVAASASTSAPHGFGVINHSPLLSLR